MNLTRKLTGGLMAAGMAVAGLAFSSHALASSSVGVQTVSREQAGDKDDAAVLSRATLTADQAQQAAIAAYPGATVTSASLEDENGAPTYSVLLTAGGKQLDVKVNAVSGHVVRADSDESGEGQAD